MDLQAITVAKANFNKKFGYIKRRLTNIEIFLNKTENPTSHLLKTKFEAIEKIFSEFETITSNVMDSLTEDIFNETYERDCSDFEERYHNIKSTILSLIERLDNHNDKKDIPIQMIPRSTIKLPELDIPYFEGDPLKWVTFKDIFEAVIHNNSQLSDIMKFTYLQNHLKGDAKQSLGHVEISDAGYSRAWSELNHRFNNPRIIVEKHIDALIDLQPIINSNATDMRKFTNTVLSHVTALEACEVAFDKYSEIVVMRLVVRKLDKESKKEWEEENSSIDIPKWKKFREFLEKRCRVLESLSSSSQNSVNKYSTNNLRQTQFKPSYNTPRTKTTSLVTNNSNTNQLRISKCKICNGSSHAFFGCPTFLKLVPSDRFNKIKEIRACINCLNPYHTVVDCRSSGCKLCNKNHHTLLHRDQTINGSQIPDIPNKQSNCNNIQTNETINNQTSTSIINLERNNFSIQKMFINKTIILSTAIILLKRPNGKYVECRALLDSGSQSNFITKSLAKTLDCKINNINSMHVNGISSTSTNVSEMISTELKSRYGNSRFTVDFFMIDKISNNLPQNSFNINRWCIPANVHLADPNFNESRPIDILLGAEIFPNILLPNRIPLKPNLPILQESLFGWILFGKHETHLEQNCLHTSFVQQEDSISPLLTKFWEIENIPAKKFLSPEEKICEKHFEETHYRDCNGRYHVFLPLRENVVLGDSKQIAAKRFSYLERKLDNDPKLKEQYIAFMKEYLALGHMNEVNESEQSYNVSYYIPHHAILRPTSSSTKIRVVFDASAKSSNGKSLNDMMLVGATVQSYLFSIILRFRKYQYAMTSDIQKMYRQVYVDSSQTALQRILWRENPKDTLKIFELATVTYGTATAPFLATRSMKQLALDDQSKFPLASQAVLNDTYVDDIVTGADTFQEAFELQSQLCELTSGGCFQLHKWCTNDERLLERIPEQNRETLKTNEFSNGECIKALGLFWQPKEDFFVFHIPVLEEITKITKRKVLSEIAKLFDPLGLLSPIIVTAKLLIQTLWQDKLDWDEIIPTEIEILWTSFRNNLPAITEIQLPRCVIAKNSVLKRTELHGFADASEKVYGACLYVRTIDIDNNVNVNLLCRKSRVAPLKTITLPHLELCAALLLSKLVTSTIQSLNIHFQDVILWTDSSITLLLDSYTAVQTENFCSQQS